MGRKEAESNEGDLAFPQNVNPSVIKILHSHIFYREQSCNERHINKKYIFNNNMFKIIE